MADRLQVDSTQFVASVGRERPSAQENSPVFEVPVSYPSAGEGVDLMVQPETLQGSSPQHFLPPHATALQETTSVPSSGAQTTSQANMGFQRDYAHGRRLDEGETSPVQRDILKEGSPQPLLQSHSSDLQAVVPEPKSVGSNLAQNQGIHQVHGLAPQQLSTFPRSAWSENWQARSSRPPEHASQSAAHDVSPNPRSPPTANEDLGRSEQPSVHGLGSQQLSTWQARSPRPPEHASQSAAHDVPPIPTSLPTANEDLGRSGQPSVHSLEAEQLRSFPRSAPSETRQIGSPQPPQHANTNVSHNALPKPRSNRAHREHLGSGSHSTHFGVRAVGSLPEASFT